MPMYKIADLLVQMDTFGRTEKQAASYMVHTERVPDLIISPEFVDRYKKGPNMTDDECEYLNTGSVYYRRLIHFNGIMLHASCVVVDGIAYLFSAPSGTGKSTHTSLWLKLFGDRAYILNDDKPAIRVLEDGIYVYGTPWSGKHNINRNAKAKFGGICFVNRAPDNSICKMEYNEAFYSIMNQTLRSKDPVALAMTMEIIGQIVSTGRVYNLFCNMNISAAELSYQTMCEKRISYED